MQLRFDRVRILLAEDDPEMRDMIASALRNDGHDVTIAQDGGDLVARLALSMSARGERAFDVVVSDIRMPVCSGTHVLEGLRGAHWTTPMILMTAFGDATTRAFVESHGGILFDKPFDLDDLRTAVLHLSYTSDRERDAPVRPLVGAGSLLARAASCENALDAWTIKWTLRAEGIASYVGGNDVYVMGSDATKALELVARLSDSITTRR
jgi:DNA-binding response OmpR family regulator